MDLEELTRLEEEARARLAHDAGFRDGWRTALRFLGERMNLADWDPPVPLLLTMSRDPGRRWVGVLEEPLNGRTVALSSAEAVILALLGTARRHVVTAAMLASLREGNVRAQVEGLAVPKWMHPLLKLDGERTVRKHVARLRRTLAQAGFGELVASSRGQFGGYRVTRGVWVMRARGFVVTPPASLPPASLPPRGSARDVGRASAGPR